MGFFYDEYLAEPVFPERFSVAVIAAVLEKFAAVYDPADDSATWFEKVKTITTEVGFTTDMKAYKADPSLSRHRGRRFRFPAPGPSPEKENSPGPVHRHADPGQGPLLERIQAALKSL